MDKRLWRAATLFFGLTAVFTLLLSAPVRVLLLRPLLYLGWLIAQQPQSTVWAGAGTVGFLVAFYSWRRALPKRL
ncbi:MAG TPA: hypothetical protein ENI38_02235, partial [Candidatus Acetothermia bacterium]|nr:hypothetical protein [Candidatus Acetothermia bacterium]